MPGVLNSNSDCSFSKEVGKMAFFMDPALILMDDNTTDFEDIANRIFGTPSTSASTSQYSSATSSVNGDSDGELPDETQVDLLKFLETPDMDNWDIPRLNCSSDCRCAICHDLSVDDVNKYVKYRVSERTDPFMGMGLLNQQLLADTPSPTATPKSPSSQSSSIISPFDCDSDYNMQQQLLQQQGFSGWNHTRSRVTEDEPELDQSINPLATLGIFCEDDIEEVPFCDTPSPSSRSGTVTADDSDVDIETVTETPCPSDFGYSTQGSSPPLSPSSSPGPLRHLQNGSLLTILAKSKSSSNGSKPSVHFSTYGVSSSASLAENLMSGRTSLLGQKRKLSKEKKVGKNLSSPSTSSSSAYAQALSTSVNFHDYAMSPASCSFPSPSSSTETGRPTVLSKRIYKRKQAAALDATEIEKQHHHNQLERNRRQKLADLFIDLRDEVPKIANQAKASKVVILNESTLYIRELQKHEKKQEEEIAREAQKKESLRKQLQLLKAQLGRK